MIALTVVFALVLVSLVILVVSAPVRAALRPHRRARERGPGEGPGGVEVSPERGELEAAREAKYREIRDAELDYRTGKLSHEDYATLSAALRAEALQILDRLDAQSGAAEHRRPDG